MKKSLIISAASFTSLFILSALAVYAQVQPTAAQDLGAGITTVDGLIDKFTKSIVKSTGVLFLSLGVVAFFWGVVQYIWGVRNAEPKTISEGNKFMGYGLLALFVMFSVYGIVKYGQEIIFGKRDMTTIVIPEINFKGKSSAPLTDPGTKTEGSSPLVNPGTRTEPSSPIVNPGGGTPGTTDGCIGLSKSSCEANAGRGCGWNGFACEVGGTEGSGPGE